MSQKVSVGRIVQYTMGENRSPETNPTRSHEVRPALVVAVNDDGSPVLRVFGRTPGDDFAVGNGPAAIQESNSPGTPDAAHCWSRPPRV